MILGRKSDVAGRIMKPSLPDSAREGGLVANGAEPFLAPRVPRLLRRLVI